MSNDVVRTDEVSSVVEFSDLCNLNIYGVPVTSESTKNQKSAAIYYKIKHAPKVDLNDPLMVQQRMDDYFILCAYLDYTPGFCQLAALIGKSRSWVWAVINGKTTGGSGYEPKVRPEVANILKKAYEEVEGIVEGGLLNGGGNGDIGRIFILKNSAGYSDKTEHVITPNTSTEEIIDADEIRKRYLPESTENSEE